MKINKKEKKLIEEFNTPETNLVISRWPFYANPSSHKATKGHRATKGRPSKGTFDGIATYTENTIKAFAEYKSEAKFIILAEVAKGGKIISQVSKNVLLVRAFDDKKIHLYPQVLRWLGLFNQIKQVYVHSEFCASGGPHMRVLMIPFLTLIKLTGRTISYYAHNVVTDLSEFAGHFNLHNRLKIILMSWGLRQYFRAIALVIDRFIVLEKHIVDRLQVLIGKKTILVQPHWIEPTKKKLTSQEAKKRLGISGNKTLVVAFGFVTYYKGADWLADFVGKHTELNKDFEFVLAGGKAYSLEGMDYYCQYYRKIEAQAENNKNLKLTGFLNNEEIELWMTAADVVIFPYRSLMGGSGALQQALRFGKRILFSKEMFTYLKRDGFRSGLKELELKQSDIEFGLNTNRLVDLLIRLRNDKNYRKQLQVYSQRQAERLSAKCLVSQHFEEVYRVEEKEAGLIGGLAIAQIE